MHAAYTVVGELESAVQVPLTADGGYYWFGTLLCVELTVTNDSDASVGPVGADLIVRDLDGALLHESTTYAPVYSLAPGRDVAWLYVYDLPDHAGSPLHVTIEAAGTQPCQYKNVTDLVPSGVDLMEDVGGIRSWYCSFTTSCPYPTSLPVMWAWECDEDGRLAATSGSFGQQELMVPYAFTGLLTSGMKPTGPITSVEYYGQALEVRHTDPYPVFRFYNFRNNAHIYTASFAEAQRLRTTPKSFSDEGIAYYADPFNNILPLFRFLNLRTGSHFYTADPAEEEVVRTQMTNHYKFEGFNLHVNLEPVEDSIPVYRFFNVRNGCHFYTADPVEAEIVKTRWPSIYRYEGIGFWVGQ